jgi:hypothetical protein
MAAFVPQPPSPGGNYPIMPSLPSPTQGQTITASDGTQLDAGVVNLARAIRKHESGDSYTKSGDAGTSLGAYQFNNGHEAIPQGGIPSNFKAWATQYGLNPNDFSPVNQDKVAYARVKELKDRGLHARAGGRCLERWARAWRKTTLGKRTPVTLC